MDREQMLMLIEALAGLKEELHGIREIMEHKRDVEQKSNYNIMSTKCGNQYNDYPVTTPRTFA